MVKRICENCRKEFRIADWLVRKGGGKFCSRRCYWEYRCRGKQVGKVMAKCLFCGRGFEVWRCGVESGGGKFCSRRCADLYKRKRVKRVCLNCGKEFEILPSEVRKGLGKFCSLLCLAEFKKKRVKRKCLNCGKEFEAANYLVRDGGGKFCSKECCLKYMKEKSKVRKKVCLFCGEEFEVYECEVNKRKFCSWKCYKEYVKSEKVRKQCSKRSKELWQNSEYRDKVAKAKMEAVQIKPNGLEKAFCNLLQNYFPNEWQYVGDGKVFIAGFVPDFIHRSKKWIIEVNGDYWHSLPKVRERDREKKEIYEKYGYKALEIWESEFKSDPMAVVDKIVKTFYQVLN